MRFHSGKRTTRDIRTSVCLSVSGPWWSVSSVALLRRRRRSAMFVPQKEAEEEDASRKFNLPKVPECLHSTCICPIHCETFFPPQRPTTRPDTLLMNINCNRFCFCSTNLLTIKVAPLLLASSRRRVNIWPPTNHPHRWYSSWEMELV